MIPLLHGILETQLYPDIGNICNQTLPKIGFIAIQQETSTPIAAGFLRMVEGGFAQIDTLMSNAKESSETRHEALSRCVAALIAEATKLGLYGITATSRDEGTIKRAQSLGFRIVEEQKLIVLPLKEPPKHV